jgi:hypothetical protein
MSIRLEGGTTRTTALEIFSGIEECVSEYGYKQVQKLVGHKDLSDHELREIRARAQAAKEILAALRSNLGYQVEE